jgi:hypothetical protein
MKTHRPANESRAYLKFIAERDQALETLYVRANEEINDLLRRAMQRAIEIISYRFSQVHSDEMLTLKGRRNTEAIDHDIAIEFNLTARHMTIVTQDLNQQAYTLALVGEAEAIGRALKQPAKYEVQQKSVHNLAGKDAQGESVEGRMGLAMARIRRDIMDAVELARVKQESTQEAIERVKAVLPKPRTVKRPKQKLAKISEANSFSADPFSFGFVDDALWAKIVDAYLDAYVPKWRGPSSVFDVDAEGLTEEWYAWEVEQYLANEFVSKVRAGQDTAAKENGVVDMQWIAVVDDKTDECCLWRDGLTSTEIEQELKSGKHKDDECDSIVPPAHFNCRCTMAPMLDVQLAGEEFEKPASNAQEFESWLNS